MRVETRLEVTRVLFAPEELTVEFRLQPFPDVRNATIGRGPDGGLQVLPPPDPRIPPWAVALMGDGDEWKAPRYLVSEQFLEVLLTGARGYLQDHAILPLGPAVLVIPSPVTNPLPLAKRPEDQA